MNFSIKDRHLFGVGAAACAVCCAAPILTLLGVASAATTAVTFVFAGVVFGLVVAAGALVAVWGQRRKRTAEGSCGPTSAPIEIELSPTRDRTDL